MFIGVMRMLLAAGRFLVVSLVFSTGSIVAQDHTATHATNPLAGNSVAVAAGENFTGRLARPATEVRDAAIEARR